MEAAHCYSPSLFCETKDLILPILEYAHEKGRCSVTGGYVYRGRAISALARQYVYGDFCSGEIFSLQRTHADKLNREPRGLLKSSLRISSFGEDESGELYVLDHSGGVYRVAPP